MKKIIRILAVLLAALLAVAVLASCDLMAGPAGPVGPQGEQGEPGKDGKDGKDGEKGDKGDKGDAGRGILKTEIIDGWLYITYSDDPEHPVKVGKVSGESGAEQEGTDGLEYYPLPDGTYAVSGGTAKYMTEIVIPATHNGKTVSTILDEAFYESKNLTSITVPDSVKYIGNMVFGRCTKLPCINYVGTKAEWNAIEKDSYWYDGWSGFIECTNGTEFADPFEFISKTVYVRKKSTLKPLDNKEKPLTLEPPTKLECFAQSTEWYKVKYEGVEYYIFRGRTTEDDIEEKTFVPCSEEMTVCVDSVNIRKYPSVEDFSTVVTNAKKDAKVEVIAKSSVKKWYKVNYTDGFKKVTGFVKFSSLSEGYSKKFTKLSQEKKVYVVSENMANLRLEPIPSENGQGGGTIVGGCGVPRGTELTAVAEGNVNGVSWYKVYYKKDADSLTIECYVAKSEVSEVKPDGGYTMEELITKYHYTRFSTEITAYPYQSSINVRETPSASGKLVETVSLPNSLTLYAYGESLSGGATWCLVKTQNGKIGFAWYDSLTMDSTGKTMSNIPLSLDHLLNVYNFTRVSLTKTAKVEVKLWGEPSGDINKVVRKIAKGSAVTIVAQGIGANGRDGYYIVEVDGTYYFALQSAFS